MRVSLAAVLLAAVGLSAAPVPKDKAKAVKDEDAIQGVWRLDKFEGPDGPPPDMLDKLRLTFQDGKMEVFMDGMAREKPGTYKLDPTAKVKAIDLIPGQAPSAPGIYELDGDTLRICMSEGPNAVRPTEFKPDGKRVAVLTFKRVKDEKKAK